MRSCGMEPASQAGGRAAPVSWLAPSSRDSACGQQGSTRCEGSRAGRGQSGALVVSARAPRFGPCPCPPHTKQLGRAAQSSAKAAPRRHAFTKTLQAAPTQQRRRSAGEGRGNWRERAHLGARPVRRKAASQPVVCQLQSGGRWSKRGLGLGGAAERGRAGQRGNRAAHWAPDCTCRRSQTPGMPRTHSSLRRASAANKRGGNVPLKALSGSCLASRKGVGGPGRPGMSAARAGNVMPSRGRGTCFCQGTHPCQQGTPASKGTKPCQPGTQPCQQAPQLTGWSVPGSSPAAARHLAAAPSAPAQRRPATAGVGSRPAQSGGRGWAAGAAPGQLTLPARETFRCSNAGRRLTTARPSSSGKLCAHSAGKPPCTLSRSDRWRSAGSTRGLGSCWAACCAARRRPAPGGAARAAHPPGCLAAAARLRASARAAPAWQEAWRRARG